MVNFGKGSKYQSAIILIAGAISKVIANLITHPCGVVYSEVQGKQGQNNKNHIELIKEIIRKKGLQGLYKGKI